jgi:protein-disulfide isomerase
MTGQVPNEIPAGTTAAGDGIVLGDGPVTVDAYIDFLCPYCRQFEFSSGRPLAAMAAAGAIRLVYHPMSFLDDASTTRYSSRAGAAAGCAAERGMFFEYAYALFEHQPPEGGPGLTDAEFVELGLAVGLTDPAFEACVLGRRYLEWPPYVTEVAMARGVTATPKVLVDGVPVAADARSIAAAAGVGTSQGG